MAKIETINSWVGRQYSRLTVIAFSHQDKRKHNVWKCECICGNITLVNYSSLITGHTQSCGCYNKEKHTLPKGHAAFNQVLNGYKQGAKRRGLNWQLTVDQFRFLTKQDCHYCAAGLSHLYSQRPASGNYRYNGLDRVDNTKDYTIDNVVSCCGVCNKMKLDLSLDEFYDHIKKILKQREG